MIATEHYNYTCSGLTIEECSIFVRSTMLHIRSMSNNLTSRIIYQCYYMECKIENTIEMSGNNIERTLNVICLIFRSEHYANCL